MSKWALAEEVSRASGLVYNQGAARAKERAIGKLKV